MTPVIADPATLALLPSTAGTVSAVGKLRIVPTTCSPSLAALSRLFEYPGRRAATWSAAIGPGCSLNVNRIAVNQSSSSSDSGSRSWINKEVAGERSGGLGMVRR